MLHTTIFREECKNSEEEEQYSSEHKEEDEVADVDIHDSEVTKDTGRSKPRKTKSNIGHCNEHTTINEILTMIQVNYSTYKQAAPQRVQLHFHGLS